MRQLSVILGALLIVTILAGCGETFNGAVKDTKRIGSGVKKIFIRD